MCSWCWGFSPVILSIKERYNDVLKISLLLGGLRPGTTEPISQETRDEILHHWHAVHERTRQPFMFEGAMPDGFIYDTEPPSRAVLAFAEIRPEYTFNFFHTLQEAFYVKQKNITREEILASLAKGYDVDSDDFIKHFESKEIKNKTRMHFMSARQAGVRGFPTCILQSNNEHTLLNSGYRDFPELQAEIDDWLAE